MFKLVKSIDRANHIAVTAAWVCLVAVGFLVSYSVIFRVSGKSIDWSFDLCSFFLVFIAFLPAGPVLANNRHVRLDFVINYAPEKVRTGCNICGYLLGLFYTAVLAWQGFELSLRTFQRQEVSIGGSDIPLFIPMLLIPLGCCLFALQFLVKLVGMLSNASSQAGEERG